MRRRTLVSCDILELASKCKRRMICQKIRRIRRKRCWSRRVAWNQHLAPLLSLSSISLHPSRASGSSTPTNGPRQIPSGVSSTMYFPGNAMGHQTIVVFFAASSLTRIFLASPCRSTTALSNYDSCESSCLGSAKMCMRSHNYLRTDPLAKLKYASQTPRKQCSDSGPDVHLSICLQHLALLKPEVEAVRPLVDSNRIQSNRERSCRIE